MVEGVPANVPMIANGHPYTIRVRFPEADRSSINAIEDTVVGSATGHLATLPSLAVATQLSGQQEIRGKTCSAKSV